MFKFVNNVRQRLIQLDVYSILILLKVCRDNSVGDVKRRKKAIKTKFRNW